jgi:hypothetical protein
MCKSGVVVKIKDLVNNRRPLVLPSKTLVPEFVVVVSKSRKNNLA